MRHTVMEMPPGVRFFDSNWETAPTRASCPGVPGNVFDSQPYKHVCRRRPRGISAIRPGALTPVYFVEVEFTRRVPDFK